MTFLTQIFRLPNKASGIAPANEITARPTQKAMLPLMTGSRLPLAAAALAVLAFTSGCTNLTGLIDAHDEFGCGKPGKASCATLSQTYEAQHRQSEAELSAQDRALLGISDDESLMARTSKENHRPTTSQTGSAETTTSWAKSSIKAEGTDSQKAGQATGDSRGSATRGNTVIETLSFESSSSNSSSSPSSSPFAKPSMTTRSRRINEGVLSTTATRLQPARSPERVVMLWVLPWVDEAGDLHSTSRVWVRVKDANWRIERVRSRAIEAERPAVEP